jgi:hypothetical protein
MPDGKFDWLTVREQALAGVFVSLVIAITGTIAGSIAWIAFTVPSKLDDVILNQESMKKDQNELKTRFFVLEQSVSRQHERIIRLELQ